VESARPVGGHNLTVASGACTYPHLSIYQDMRGNADEYGDRTDRFGQG
jgi:hypothetical protein